MISILKKSMAGKMVSVQTVNAKCRMEALEVVVIASASIQSWLSSVAAYYLVSILPLGHSPQRKRSSSPAGSGPPAIRPSNHPLPKAQPKSCILSRLARVRSGPIFAAFNIASVEDRTVLGGMLIVLQGTFHLL